MSDVWLAGALVLMLCLIPLGVVSVRARPVDGLVALQATGTTAAILLVLIAAGLGRQPFVDLGLVAAAMAFAGTLAFAYFLERRE